MKKERMGAIRRRIGPLGMSLAAAAVTATAFAAIALADNDDGSKNKDRGEVERAAIPGPPHGGPGVMMFRDRLSEEDQQALEEFRQCMEDNGAPAPPRPEEFDRSDVPPEPPSEAEMENIKKAFEACEDKLPEGLPRAHPHFAPGCEPKDEEQGENRRGSSAPSGTESSDAA